MLRIGRLRITLPPGFAGRPEDVVRRVADELAGRQLAEAPGERRIGHLAPPPVEVGPRAGEREIAEQVAQAIQREIPRGR